MVLVEVHLRVWTHMCVHFWVCLCVCLLGSLKG